MLEEKGIQYQYIEVDPYAKPKELMDLNPRGLVPSMEYKGKPLYESTVLVEFLEEAFPHHSPHLLPSDPYEKARARIWCHFVTSSVIPSFHRFLQYQPQKDGKEGLEERRKEFLGVLKEFTKEMDKEGPYFLGKDFGIVDLMIAPWAVRLWVFDHFKGGLGIPEEGKGGEDEEVWARWRKWYDAVKGRRSVIETTSYQETYIPLYQKYADDTAQSQLAKATRAGQGVP